MTNKVESLSGLTFTNRLAAVNFFLGCVGVVQVSRILTYQRSQKGVNTQEVIKDDAKDVKDTVVGAAKEAGATVKSAV